MGSGTAIRYAGPAVLIVTLRDRRLCRAWSCSPPLRDGRYVHPTAGLVRNLCGNLPEPGAGTVVRYSYWMAQVIDIGGSGSLGGVHDVMVPRNKGVVVVAGLAVAMLRFNYRSRRQFRLPSKLARAPQVTRHLVFILLGVAAM